MIGLTWIQILKWLTASVIITSVFQVALSAQEKDGEVAELNERSTPEDVYQLVCRFNQAGDFKKLLSVTSQRTKGMALTGHLLQMGLLPEGQTKIYLAVTEKWEEKTQVALSDPSLQDAEDYTPMVELLSKWKHLDTYLLDVLTTTANRPRPQYGSEFRRLEENEDSVVAEVSIETNDGFLEFVEGNPLESRNVGKAKIYFVREDKVWRLSSAGEFQMFLSTNE